MQNTNGETEVYVILPAWNGAKDLPLFLETLKNTTQGYGVTLVVIDNDSEDDTFEIITTLYPSAHVIRNATNCGFAGACNQGMEYALAHGARYIMLANQDLTFGEHWLNPLRAAFENNPHLGAAQSLVFLGDSDQVLNSNGNALHYLGYGFSRGNGITKLAWDHIKKPAPFFYCSGGAVMYSAEALKKVGLFDEYYFMYHEDTDLSWRLRLAGYELEVVKDSRVHHHYEFSRSIQKFIYIERNRYITMLVNYHILTLLLITPMVLVAEAGQLLVSLPAFLRKVAVIGFSEKIKSYAFFFSFENLLKVARSRRRTQRLRVMPDRMLVPLFSDVIQFQEQGGGAVANVANILTKTYWFFVKRIIIW